MPTLTSLEVYAPSQRRPSHSQTSQARGEIRLETHAQTPRLQAHRSRHTAEADHNAWLSSITSPLALFPTPRSEGRGPSRSRPCHPRATKISQSAPQTQALRNVKRFAQQAVGMGMGMGIEIETGMGGSFALPIAFISLRNISAGTGIGRTEIRHSVRERGRERAPRVSGLPAFCRGRLQRCCAGGHDRLTTTRAGRIYSPFCEARSPQISDERRGRAEAVRWHMHGTCCRNCCKNVTHSLRTPAFQRAPSSSHLPHSSSDCAICSVSCPSVLLATMYTPRCLPCRLRTHLFRKGWATHPRGFSFRKKKDVITSVGSERSTLYRLCCEGVVDAHHTQALLMTFCQHPTLWNLVGGHGNRNSSSTRKMLSGHRESQPVIYLTLPVNDTAGHRTAFREKINQIRTPCIKNWL